MTAKMWLPQAILVAAQPHTMSRLRMLPTTAVRAVAPALPAATVRPIERAAVPTAPPAQKTETPAVPPAVVNAVTLSAAGLPVRKPGAHGVTRSAAGAAGADAFVDPETVRARLASLASGIAAAQRRVGAPPGDRIWSEE